MSRDRLLLFGFVMCILASFSSVNAQLEDPVIVNVMIGAELDPGSGDMPPEEKRNLEVEPIIQMLNEIDPRGLNVTVYVTGDFVSEFAGNAWYKLYVTRVGSKPNHELAIYGMTTDEKLSTTPYTEQYGLIREAKRLVESAYICGGRVIEVKGFMPQSFDQSETTYNILDKTGIKYDAGYQAGVLYAPGHEDDVWPYPVENRNFYAVPVSTHQHSKDLVPLSDQNSKDVLGLNGSQWYDLLVGEFEECRENKDPMVVIFHNTVSGLDEEYLEAYSDFIEYAASNNANFVSTLELVEMAGSR